MSDTPETDAAKFTTYSTRHLKYIEAVTVDFARAQERRIARLEQICAAAYQLAGVVGAPVRFLDALALHDDVDVDSLLPVRLEECDEFQRLRSQLNKAEVERAWALRGRTFVTPEPQS